MSDKPNVFICWSGQRSRYVAEALRDWIPLLIQSAKPWMSAKDIDKGARGFQEISETLQSVKVGIVCLTPENVSAPWILFESGALSKTIDNTKLCTFLLAGIENKDVPYPLAMFQSTSPEKTDIYKLLGTLNRAVSDSPVPERDLNHLFERLWPDLEEKLSVLPEAATVAAPQRPPEDMLRELLELARADANRKEQNDWVDEYRPMLRELFPVLAQLLPAMKKDAKFLPLSSLRYAADPSVTLGPREDEE